MTMEYMDQMTGRCWAVCWYAILLFLLTVLKMISKEEKGQASGIESMARVHIHQHPTSMESRPK